VRERESRDLEMLPQQFAMLGPRLSLWQPLMGPVSLSLSPPLPSYQLKKIIQFRFRIRISTDDGRRLQIEFAISRSDRKLWKTERKTQHTKNPI